MPLAIILPAFPDGTRVRKTLSRRRGRTPSPGAEGPPPPGQRGAGGLHRGAVPAGRPSRAAPAGGGAPAGWLSLPQAGARASLPVGDLAADAAGQRRLGARPGPPGAGAVLRCAEPLRQGRARGARRAGRAPAASPPPPQIACWAEADSPLVEYPPAAVGPAEREIAARVARLIPDGATIQLGVGSIPQAIMEALGEKRDLGVHSLLVDSVLPLIEKGVITNARKTLHPGRMDIGEAMGTRTLFDFVHNNPMVNMEPSDIIHDPQVVGRIRDFISINSAFEVDLAGQVNAEMVGPRQLTGVGGPVAARAPA